MGHKMSKIEIRKANESDLPKMQEIARRTIDRCYRSFLGEEGVDWFINSGESDKELQKHIANTDLLLKDGDIAAFTIYFEDFIHLMMVDVDLHRGGIGSQLLAHCEKKISNQGYKSIRLETFETNHQAVNFYKKNGWTIVRKEKEEGIDVNRIFLEKEASHN